jgi:hypothetical protein
MNPSAASKQISPCQARRAIGHFFLDFAITRAFQKAVETALDSALGK